MAFDTRDITKSQFRKKRLRIFKERKRYGTQQNQICLAQTRQVQQIGDAKLILKHSQLLIRGSGARSQKIESILLKVPGERSQVSHETS